MSENRADTNLIQERYNLISQRLREIASEDFPVPELARYFHEAAFFLLREEGLWNMREKGLWNMPEEAFMGEPLFADLEGNAYESSYANPAYAVRKLGRTIGRYLSFLYYELKALSALTGGRHIPDKRDTAARVEERLIRMELFTEVYTAFVYEWEEKKALPEKRTLRGIFYWYVWDYAEMAAQNRLEELADAWGTETDGAGKEESVEGPGNPSDKNPPDMKQPDINIKDISILYKGWILEEACIPNRKVSVIAPKCLEDHAEDMSLVLDKALAGRLLEVLHSVLEKYSGRLHLSEKSNSVEKASASVRTFALGAHPQNLQNPEQRIIGFNEGQRQLLGKYYRKRDELFREYFFTDKF